MTFVYPVWWVYVLYFIFHSYESYRVAAFVVASNAAWLWYTLILMVMVYAGIYPSPALLVFVQTVCMLALLSQVVISLYQTFSFLREAQDDIPLDLSKPSVSSFPKFSALTIFRSLFTSEHKKNKSDGTRTRKSSVEKDSDWSFNQSEPRPERRQPCPCTQYLQAPCIKTSHCLGFLLVSVVVLLIVHFLGPTDASFYLWIGICTVTIALQTYLCQRNQSTCPPNSRLVPPKLARTVRAIPVLVLVFVLLDWTAGGILWMDLPAVGGEEEEGVDATRIVWDLQRAVAMGWMLVWFTLELPHMSALRQETIATLPGLSGLLTKRAHRANFLKFAQALYQLEVVMLYEELTEFTQLTSVLIDNIERAGAGRSKCCARRISNKALEEQLAQAVEKLVVLWNRYFSEESPFQGNFRPRLKRVVHERVVHITSNLSARPIQPGWAGRGDQAEMKQQKHLAICVSQVFEPVEDLVATEVGKLYQDYMKVFIMSRLPEVPPDVHSEEALEVLPDVPLKIEEEGEVGKESIEAPRAEEHRPMRDKKPRLEQGETKEMPRLEQDGDHQHSKHDGDAVEKPRVTSSSKKSQRSERSSSRQQRITPQSSAAWENNRSSLLGWQHNYSNEVELSQLTPYLRQREYVFFAPRASESPKSLATGPSARSPSPSQKDRSSLPGSRAHSPHPSFPALQVSPILVPWARPSNTPPTPPLRGKLGPAASEAEKLELAHPQGGSNSKLDQHTRQNSNFDQHQRNNSNLDQHQRNNSNFDHHLSPNDINIGLYSIPWSHRRSRSLFTSESHSPRNTVIDTLRSHSLGALTNLHLRTSSSPTHAKSVNNPPVMSAHTANEGASSVVQLPVDFHPIAVEVSTSITAAISTTAATSSKERSRSVESYPAESPKSAFLKASNSNSAKILLSSKPAETSPSNSATKKSSKTNMLTNST